MFDPGFSAFFSVHVDDSTAGNPGYLGSRGHVEIFDDFVVEGHDPENGGHQVKEPAFFRLLKGAGESPAWHLVGSDRMIESFEW